MELSTIIKGKKLTKVSGEVLTSEKINDYNDFGKKDLVKTAKFKNVKIADNKLNVTLPSKSVVILEIY